MKSTKQFLTILFILFTVNYGVAQEIITQIFNPKLNGNWVLINYIESIKKTKSPLKSSYILDGLVEINIDTKAEIDSTGRLEVGANLNNHEGFIFGIYRENDRIYKTDIEYLSDNDQNYFTLEIIPSEKDTLKLSEFNSKHQIVKCTKYVRISGESNSEISGIDLITNEILITGEYNLIDLNGLSKKIVFDNLGNIIGMDDFDQYIIITDLSVGPLNNLDEIGFKNSKSGNDYTYFSFVIEKDNILIFKIKEDKNHSKLLLNGLKYKFEGK
jgi:hypothetical protein